MLRIVILSIVSPFFSPRTLRLLTRVVIAGIREKLGDLPEA